MTSSAQPQPGTAQPQAGSGAVFDLGYKPHDGQRLGRRGAMMAAVREGVRRVFGLRRKARKKVLPWTLLVFAVIPAVVVVGLSILISDFLTEAPDVLDHAGYFDFNSVIVLLFVALSAPELLIPDREQGVLSIYASRPLTWRDYLTARAGALAITVMAFMLIPQLTLYFGQAAVADNGFLGHVFGEAAVLGKILLAAVFFLATYGSIAFVVAAYAKRIAIAATLYLVVAVGSLIVVAIVVESRAFTGSRWAALFAFEHHPRHLRDWIFGNETPTIVREAGIDPWVSLVVVVAMVTTAAIVVINRYRRLR